ncbi:MAG: DUF448 domain-containing protein [Alteraurantiacibacter sp.]
MRIPHNEPLGSDRSGKRGGNSDAPADAPARRCVLTGNHSGRDDMLRLAVSPDGLVLPDALARAPGRGAWIGVSKADLAIATANGKLKGALARAFKDGSLTIPDDLADKAHAALARALVDRLGLEMRAGFLMLGSDRIANEARSGKVAMLYHAADASADGSRKLDQAWRVGLDQEGSGLVGEFLPLDREALSVALGRDNVVHLALADAGAARRVLVPLQRLQAFLGSAGAPAAEQPAGEMAAEDIGDDVADSSAHDTAH